MFFVGQKVVCVDAKSPSLQNYNRSVNLLVERQVYTVAWGGADPFFGVSIVQIVELPVENQFGRQIYYQAKRFRPLTERKTDISVFIEMLDKSPVKTMEPAR